MYERRTFSYDFEEMPGEVRILPTHAAPTAKFAVAKALEGKRMVSGFIGNEVPRKGLRVRIPCPPL
jgi:hypothetical protein